MYFKIIDFSRYSSIKIGQEVEVLVLEKGDKIATDRYLIGGANNLLIPPNPPLLMMLGKDFSTIHLENNILTIGASMATGRVISFARKNNIAGFEFLAKLPGTVGGMLAMNAGVKSYEIFNILDAININGEWIKKDNIEYGYRFAQLNGIALEVKFNIDYGFSEELLNDLLNLRSNQPKEPSAGSVFKNPKNDYAGRLIESVGLKGFKYGDMAFSNIHSNFIVNLGNGQFKEAKYLIDLAKDRVFKEFNILLEEEIKILDRS